MQGQKNKKKKIIIRLSPDTARVLNSKLSRVFEMSTSFARFPIAWKSSASPKYLLESLFGTHCSRYRSKYSSFHLKLTQIKTSMPFGLVFCTLARHKNIKRTGSSYAFVAKNLPYKFRSSIEFHPSAFITVCVIITKIPRYHRKKKNN